ncbi:hypothetical protein [Photobacterium leiognathi]|nr:hypothetical protein [Photobacterium leiognathi]
MKKVNVEKPNKFEVVFVVALAGFVVGIFGAGFAAGLAAGQGGSRAS